MFQLKLILLLIAFTFVSSTDDYQVIEGIKRSAVCLVERIAKHNHITAKYEKIQEQRNGATLIRCKLDLGTEAYTANSTSLSKAKEKVSRQAYALTKYEKPSLGNRTCIIHHPSAKSDISLLEEYAQSIRAHVLYSEKPRHPNGTFECDVTLDGKSGSGIGASKKSAKTAAATHLLSVIGRAKVTDTLTAKYNQPGYHNMEPTTRLRKIIRVTELNGDVHCTKTREVTERSVKRIIVQMDTSTNGKSSGSGVTFEEACSNAAINLLRHMNFNVNYVHTTTSH